MLRFFCCFLVIHLALGGSGANLPKPPRFALNLDLPEEERWVPILKHWSVVEYQDMVHKYFSKFTTKETIFFLDIIGEAIENFLPAPYAGEIRGMAKYFQINVGEMVFLNIFYDVSVGCTSIVAEDSKGNIWHGRNMDYTSPTTLKNLTVVVDFQTKGKTVYTTTSFLGQAGAFTGQRPNAFTVSFNQKDQGTIADDIIQILKALISDKTVFTSFQIRDALSRNDTATYDSALQRLTTVPQTAPNYYIIGGTKTTEGAVITKERLKAVDVWHLNSTEGRWFLLETNYDHWMPPPKDDDRRDPGNKAMNATGSNAIDLSNLLVVLSIPPVCNDITIYTTLMSAAHPENYTTFLRHCD